uniref:Uncharacterized protein n=1 Tax=Trichuris muris TaxID=70415 RepID=A0A5S6QS50_TRIMR
MRQRKIELTDTRRKSGSRSTQVPEPSGAALVRTANDYQGRYTCWVEVHAMRLTEKGDCQRTADARARHDDPRSLLRRAVTVLQRMMQRYLGKGIIGKSEQLKDERPTRRKPSPNRSFDCNPSLRLLTPLAGCGDQ